MSFTPGDFSAKPPVKFQKQARLSESAEGGLVFSNSLALGAGGRFIRIMKFSNYQDTLSFTKLGIKFSDLPPRAHEC
jgi:hypothetical protein